MSYNSKYKGAEVESLLDKVNNMDEIPTKVSELDNDAGYVNENQVNTKLTSKQDKVMIVDHGTDDTTFALTPNVLHKWGTVTSLTLTLADASNTSVANYYMVEFKSGTTATSLSVPDTITWSSVPNIESGKIYQISILNNLGVIGGF